MVAIFASASALLTPEFVESFDPEKLASKFVRVEKEYGVKFNKTSRTFNIVGHWEAVQNAHKSLKKLMGAATREEVEEIVQVTAEVKREEGETEFCETGEEIGDGEQSDSHTTSEQSVYKIKGNPKRGRYTGEAGRAGVVPDPVVFFQYQDKSFSDQDSFNIDAVLDEFERAQINKKVTKEDLKKILEKNTEQMGRPLNKGLPRGASLPVKKLHLKALTNSSEQLSGSSQALLSALTPPLDTLESQPDSISASIPHPTFTLVQPGSGSMSSTGIDSSNTLIFHGQERYLGNFQPTGVSDLSWLSYNSQGYSCLGSEVRGQGQVADSSVINMASLSSVPQAGGPLTNEGGAAKAFLDVANQLTAATVMAGQHSLGVGDRAGHGEVSLSSSLSEAVVTNSTQSHVLLSGTSGYVTTVSSDSSPVCLPPVTADNPSNAVDVGHYPVYTEMESAQTTGQEWIQPSFRQMEDTVVIKGESNTEIPAEPCLVLEGEKSNQLETGQEGKEMVDMETAEPDIVVVTESDIKAEPNNIKAESVEDLSARSAVSQTVVHTQVQTQSETKVEKKPVKAKRKPPSSKKNKGDKENQSLGQSGTQNGGNQDAVKTDKSATVKKSKPMRATQKAKSSQKTRPAAKPTELNSDKPTDANMVHDGSDDETENPVECEKAPADDGVNTTAGSKRAPKTKSAKEKKEPKVYHCTECDYKGCRKKRLTEHMGRVHGLLTENCRGTQEKTTFPCDLCDKTFVFGKDLNRHKKIVHHGQVHFCSICQKSYKSKYVFDKHMTTHEEGYVQPMFPCKICDRQFTTKFSLSCHIKSEHLGLKKTFLCPTCGKSFSQIRSYRQHANVHAGIRPYVCEICGKSFTYDKSLKEHRYMHDNIRRFPCNVCGKAFRQRTCLLIHMKVHKDSKDHICSSCGKGFTQKQSLLRHERIHSGDKPYTCKLCQKSFSDYAVIRKHMLMSHKKDKNDWKDDVDAEAKKTSDHYIVGGPGYVPREPCSQVREKNFATVIPPKNPGGPTMIIDHGEQTKKESEMVALGEHSQLPSSQPTASLYSNVLDISSVQDSHSNATMTDLTSLYQPLPSSLYPNTSYTVSPHLPVQEMGMTGPDSGIKPQDIDGSLHAAGEPMNYGSLQAMPSQAFSGAADSGLGTDESMVAAFLKAQGRQASLGTDIFASLGSLATASVSSVEQTPRGQGQMSFGLSSVPMTTNVTDPVATNAEVTTATSNISWGYPGYSAFYNSANFSQFQSTQQN